MATVALKKRRPPRTARKKATSALVRREPRDLVRREDQKPATARQPLAATDLQELVKAHAVQASQLANQLAQSESAMIAMLKTTDRPDTALRLVHQLEQVRRSAVDDLRQATRLLEELKYPPVALAAVLGDDQRAFYASGSSRVLGKPRVQSEEE